MSVVEPLNTAENFRPDLRLVKVEEDAPALPDEAYQDTPWTFSDDFPRLKNGLLDISAYDEYLTTDPEEYPPIVRNADQKGLRHQHMYYWRRFFRQHDIPRDIRDLMLMRFWRSPYNQILMEISQERKVHQKHNKLVSPPPISVMEDSLVDFDALDMAGAAAVGRRIAMVPEAFDGIALNEEAHDLTTLYSPTEIAAFCDTAMETALTHLHHPLVTPQRVITGAIRRMSKLTNNERLLAEAAQRLEEDPKYYPVRIHDARELFVLSRGLLDRQRLVLVTEVQ